MVSPKLWVASFLAGGMLIAGSGCGGPSREARAIAERDAQIAEYKEESAQKDQQVAQNAAIAQRAMEENKRLGEQQSQIVAENAKMTAANTQELQNLQAQIADMKTKFGEHAEVSQNKETGAIVITVANTTLFDAGKAELKASAHETLAKIAATIKQKYPNNAIRVEGHTDSTPVVHNKDKYPDNMSLSQARAKAVFDHLVATCSMPATRMYCAGYGFSQPMVWPEKTPADRAKNRRVDIVILPQVKVERQALAANAPAKK